MDAVKNAAKIHGLSVIRIIEFTKNGLQDARRASKPARFCYALACADTANRNALTSADEESFSRAVASCCFFELTSAAKQS